MDKIAALKLISNLDGLCYKNGTRANVHMYKLGFEKCDVSTTGLTRKPVLRFQGMKHRKLCVGGKAVRVAGNKMRYFTPEELPSACNFISNNLGDTWNRGFTKGGTLRVGTYVDIAVIEGFNDPWLALD